MKDVERIKNVLTKANLSNEEIELLTSHLIAGESKIQIPISIKEVEANTEINVPEWFPGKLLQHTVVSDKESDYSVDLSSIFMVSPLDQIKEEVVGEVALDVCAAPGGKTILTNIICKPKLIWANEKSRERYVRLKDNITRLKLRNIEPINFDARILREFKEYEAKIVIVDAPCTGQALLGKGFTNYSAFGNPQIKSISAMQRGILSSVRNKVIPGGYILYSTCTFSREENEDNLKWFLKKNEDFKTIKIERLSKYQSTIIDHDCYRLYPQYKEGAGGFTCLLRREEA